MRYRKNMPTLAYWLCGIFASVILLLGLQTSLAIEIPPSNSIAFIQTNGPNAALNKGDFYSSINGANEPHIIKFFVPCTWPADVPITVALFDPESQVPDPISPSAIDEIDGAPDDTMFVLKSPAGETIRSVTYTPDGGTNGLWVELVTFTPGTDGYGCGEYVLEARTADNDEQSWRLSVAHDPDCTVSMNGSGTCSGAGTRQSALLASGNERNDVDGQPGTGDAILVNVLQVAFQHAGSECQDFFFFVNADDREVTLHNFDMDIDDLDPTATVTYYPPTPPGEPERRIPGTVSGNNSWNNGTAAPPFPPERVGDTLVIEGERDAGWWRAELCAADKNQYVFESEAEIFYEQPPAPVMQVAKDDGVVETSPNSFLTYTIVFTNTSDTTTTPGAAANVVLTDQLPANVRFQECTINAPFTGTCTADDGGVIATLDGLVVAGARGSMQITVQVAPDATGTVINEVRLDYQDVLGNQYRPVFDDDVDIIRARPVIEATKRVVTNADDLGNGCEALAGDRLRYTVTITNSGSIPAEAVVFEDTPDARTRLLVGTVQTSQGIVTQGNTAGDTAVGVAVGTLAAGARITIAYETSITEPLPEEQVTIVNQGQVRGANIERTLTDDPATPAANDPTQTVGCQRTPTAIVLEHFTATRQDGAIIVRWTTSAEINTWGFHLYRSSTGQRENTQRITPEMILAQGRGQGGAAYRWTDPDVAAEETYTYWLQEIELDGTQHEYGPAEVAVLTADWRIFLPVIER